MIRRTTFDGWHTNGAGRDDALRACRDPPWIWEAWR